METTTTEIADGVYELSTYVEPADFTFNQFLVVADDPLLFHCGLRSLFPLVSDAVSRVVPLDRLRWLTFGHVEADECGSMNEWLAAAPRAQVAHGAMGCVVSVNDLADRPPHPMNDGDVLDLGGKRVRYVATPHVPHGWDAGVVFEETTRTLLCGDLFTRMGAFDPVTESDIVGPAVDAEAVFQATCLTPATAPTIRSLADLDPTTLGLMHGSAFTGDAKTALGDLAGFYADRLAAAA